MKPEERASRISQLWRFERRYGQDHDEIEKHIAAAIRDAEAEALRWIPVGDELPNEGEVVEVGWWYRNLWPEFGAEWKWIVAHGEQHGGKWRLPQYAWKMGATPQYWRRDTPPAMPTESEG